MLIACCVLIIDHVVHVVYLFFLFYCTETFSFLLCILCFYFLKGNAYGPWHYWNHLRTHSSNVSEGPPEPLLILIIILTGQSHNIQHCVNADFGLRGKGKFSDHYMKICTCFWVCIKR